MEEINGNGVIYRRFPTPISIYVPSPRRILAEEARVSKLINQDTKWWNSNFFGSTLTFLELINQDFWVGANFQSLVVTYAFGSKPL